MYYDQYTMYGQKEFGQFLDTLKHSNDVLYHIWLIEQKTKIEYTSFDFYGHTYM